MGLAIPAARVTCGTIAVAPRKDPVARAREALPGYSIFISYAHEDEAFKNALTQRLIGLQRQDVIAHDGRHP